MTIRQDFVTMGGMTDTENAQQSRRSFSNGNAPDTTELPLEGWVIRPVHWWYF